MKSINVFLEEYISAAITHGKATLEGDHKTANKQYSKLTKLYRTLENDESFAEACLEKLFDHTNASIRIWTAAHALGLNINVDQAIRVLQEASKDRSLGILRLDAEMTLKEWQQKGRLKF